MIEDRKPEEIQILKRIRAITDERPTYGYPRVTALLRKELVLEGLAPINHKRVYRIMRENNLILTRYEAKRTRTHDGTIVTLKSNLRWCTDIFQIRCWNGDLVRVAFSLDCCDREAMRYVASSSGIDGSLIRDLMTETLEYRFGPVRRTPHKIQWLSDNGPQFVSHETIEYGRALGFEMCTSPAYCPESNGMAEAFVKRFKRDYVYVNKLEDARSVMEQLPAWFRDYNQKAPHKGLKMMSPWEYLIKNQSISVSGFTG